MVYDDVIQRIAKVGRYHRKRLFVLSLVQISWAFHKMGGVFLEAKPDFRCLLPNENPDNATYEISPNISNAGYLLDNEIKNWPRCEIYNPDIIDPYQTSNENVSSTHPTIKCDSFVYDKSEYTWTTTTEWNLVCDNSWLTTLADSLLMLADLPGVLLWTGLSDKYGRKRILLVAMTIQFVSALLLTITPAFISFIVLRMCIGVTLNGTYLITYVFALEMVRPQDRMSVGNRFELSSIIGYLFLTGFAYLIRNWRMLQFVYTIPSFLFLLFSRYIPESPRWLLSKGRTREAQDILHKVSLAGGAELSPDTLDCLLEDGRNSQSVIEKISLFDVLRYPNLRKRSLILFFAWFVNILAFFGISWNTSNLGGNNYLNFFIVVLMEVPAQLFIYLTLNRWGRKFAVCGGLYLAAISLLPTIFFPEGVTWLIVVSVMIAKFAFAISISTLYIYTSELYPTTIRNIGIGACSAAGRIGGVGAASVSLLFEVSIYLPFILFGALALLSGSLALLLPETLNKKLPETLDESEQFGKRTSETDRDINQSDDVESSKIKNCNEDNTQ